MNDLISVVIPTYNRRDKLPACIASVLAQTYRNIEVIVVDDASTDGTERLFDRGIDPRVHYVRYGDNRGACYARNLGAQQARGRHYKLYSNLRKDLFLLLLLFFHLLHCYQSFLELPQDNIPPMLMDKLVLGKELVHLVGRDLLHMFLE